MSDNSELNDEAEELEEIPEELQVVLNDPTISEEKKEEIREAFIISITSITRTFSGPLPHPEILNEYNQVLPSAAERIIAMAERQAEHRMGLEKIAIPSQIDQSKRGQTFGFILVIIALIASVILGIYGQTAASIAIGTTSIITIATIFVLGKRYQKKKVKE